MATEGRVEGKSFRLYKGAENGLESISTSTNIHPLMYPLSGIPQSCGNLVFSEPDYSE
ncbi:hypothetical protein SAMN04488691_103162 [Haloferax larsenii]|uniref:Uncharacterized protein n=1 Tax=Haloferax larsenii TaxID=302484 RepID=A0A1H7N133_HALLR|nr:hypothetical protein SAMN04488691_103162 [Haloferax larsenii]